MRPLAKSNRERRNNGAVSQLSQLYIVSHLKKGARKFDELQRSISGIRREMLVEQLRELERAGLVSRSTSLQVSSKDEYALTPSGQKLKGIAEALEVWGRGAPTETESEQLL